MEEVKLNLNESLERSKEDESIKIIEENEEKPDK